MTTVGGSLALRVLSDGRLVSMYGLVFGRVRLCVGDESGNDDEW